MNKKFVKEPTDVTLEETAAWFGKFPKGGMNLGESDYETLLRDASNVVFAEGVAEGKQRVQKALDAAIHEAESAAEHFNVLGGKKLLIQVIADEKEPLRMEELKSVDALVERFNHDMEMKYVMNERDTNGKVIVKLAVASLPEK